MLGGGAQKRLDGRRVAERQNDFARVNVVARVLCNAGLDRIKLIQQLLNRLDEQRFELVGMRRGRTGRLRRRLVIRRHGVGHAQQRRVVAILQRRLHTVGRRHERMVHRGQD